MERLDLWNIESKIYPKLDAAMMRGEVSYKENFDLGQGQRFNISVSSKNGSPVFPQEIFSSDSIDFSMNFGSGAMNTIRADNQANHGFLHLHHQGSLIRRHL